MNIVIVLFFISSLLLLSSHFPSVLKSAYGDGLFMEQLSASLGDRTADLLIRMSPPVVTTETIKEQYQRPEIQFRLFDPQTDKNFQQVTYFITIEKDGTRLLSDWFFSPNGNLTIQMQPRNQNQISIYGDLDPILNAYTTRGNGPVVAAGPIFVEGGLYHFAVRIVTVDFSRTILPDDKQPVFDAWLSVGASKDVNLEVNGKVLPVKILSYYDEINNISYDHTSNSINFTMPFIYELQRLNNPDNTVFIHQEIEIPKPSTLTVEGSYQGYVNGKDVTNTLMVDGNNQTKDVVHFMLTKPIVIQIVKDFLQNSTNTVNGPMEFSLSPSKNGSMTMSGIMNHTMVGLQDNRTPML